MRMALRAINVYSIQRRFFTHRTDSVISCVTNRIDFVSAMQKLSTVKLISDF